MIAALDALIPPLDRAVGFYLLIALAAGYLLARLYDRARRAPETEPDPHAVAFGDVPEPPHG
jgi:hypothetical protein